MAVEVTKHVVEHVTYKIYCVDHDPADPNVALSVFRLTDLGSVSQVAGVYQPSKGSQTSSRPSGLSISMRRAEMVDVDLNAADADV